MREAKPISTPMVHGQKFSTYDSNTMHDVQLYRSIVGALQCTTITRPEITYNANKVCQFMQNPLEAHWKAVKCIMRYLVGTLDYGLHLRKSNNLNLVGFCDVNWALDLDDQRSTSSFCIYLGFNLISWHSKKQHTVSRSNTKVEYKSLANFTVEITWLQSLLGELQVRL